MSVRVRLTRVGSKKNPIWRVVVADQRSPRDGRFIETIGHYNPQTQPSTIRIDEERLQHWLSRGAQATNTVKQLMKAQAKSGPSVVGGPAPAAPQAEETAAPAVEVDDDAAAEAVAEAAVAADAVDAAAGEGDTAQAEAGEGEPAEAPEAGAPDEAAPDEPAAPDESGDQPAS